MLTGGTRHEAEERISPGGKGGEGLVVGGVNDCGLEQKGRAQYT